MRRPALVMAILLPLLALLAGPADAKPRKKQAKLPVVTKVSPLRATVGQQLTIRGRNFRPGKARNGVGFKADGMPIVFARSNLSTRRLMTVRIPASLNRVLAGKQKRLRIRVISGRFGKRYTPLRMSPRITPSATVAPGANPAPPLGRPTLPPGATGTGVPIAGCDVTATGGGDQDSDKLTDGLEQLIGTDPCSADTDGDGVEDGFEYRSAIDLNDDEYQQPNQALPYPFKRPYPNPLFAEDADTDFDGDLLTMREEYALWLAGTPAGQRSFADPAPPAATPLSYSDGLQYSVAVRCPAGGPDYCGSGDNGRRVPALAADADPSFANFYAWATSQGYARPRVITTGRWYEHPTRTEVDIRDINLDGVVSAAEANPADVDNDGFISDDERDFDEDGLSNNVEFHGAMQPGYWAACYPLEPAAPRPFSGTDPTDADTDGDGVRDGADDEDGDGYPNLMELSRIRASGFDDRQAGARGCVPRTELTQTDANGNYPLNHEDSPGWVQPFNPCFPAENSPSCSDAYVASYRGPRWWALQ